MARGQGDPSPPAGEPLLLSDSLAPLSLSHTVSSRFLQGLRMGETLGVGSFGEVRVGTLPSGEHCAVKVRGCLSPSLRLSLTHTRWLR